VQIYKSYGISERDAAKLILEKNLYGLDIDDRAAQLAYFAVMMKARQYDRRIFSRGVEPHIYAIQESNNINRRHLKFFGWQLSDLERNMALNQLNAVLDEFNDAKEYGSILNISKQDWELLYRFVLSVDYSGQMTLEAVGLEDTKDKLFELVQIAATMEQKYDVVVTNPPYMTISNAGRKLNAFVVQNYPDSKTDISTVFMEKTLNMCENHGYMAMINIPVWMFISRFKKLREKLLTNYSFSSMLHFGRGVFGADFGTTSFVMSRMRYANYRAKYYKLFDKQSHVGTPESKEADFHKRKGEFLTTQENLMRLPDYSMGYWVSKDMAKTFTFPEMSEAAEARIGLATGNNDYYLRFWYEVALHGIGFGFTREQAKNSRLRWFPYNKGGEFRKWYGNRDYVVNWYDDGHELQTKRHPDGTRIWAHNFNLDFIFKKSLAWSDITISSSSFRAFEQGFIFDSCGTSAFVFDENQYYPMLGYLNSKLVNRMTSILNPTIHFTPGDFAHLPYLKEAADNKQMAHIVQNTVALSKTDWDSFETSWDFDCHPLIRMIAKGGVFFDIGRISLAECYMLWESECSERFNQLKANEEELNRIFIDIYGLQDELTPEVEEKDVTVRKADLGRDIRSLISYAVGCMFGRYSLNVDGLAYAGGAWDASKYQTIIPDADNIIPICDDDYFDDDITARFVQWVETVYGKETLEENLKFIANALGGKGTPREVIRNYFLNDFYADHLKIYQKRPIYWLFDSGKKNGFKALIYMHRYQSDLLARMRTDYVHEMQERYRTQLSHLTEAVSHASASERVKLNKQLKKIQDQALELQKYEEKIHHLADRNISIDLDDGVKHNYALFGDVLAKIK